MSLTSNDLSAISQLLESQFQTIRDDMKDIKSDIENSIKPQIQLLAENYIPAAKRFETASAQIETMQADTDILKEVVTEHSKKLQKIS